jgi:hypothetical protein
MAFRAKDGRAFGRRDQMNAYNERSSAKDTGGVRDSDASDERSGHETREHGGSLESKPHQPPAEVEHQQERGENPARNPNPGPREHGSSPDPGITQDDTRDRGLNPSTEDSEPDSLEDIHDVMAQSGPAEHIEIRHSGGLSHVTTSHSGGRRHVSTHPTPQAAHLHAADAAGLNQAVAEQSFPEPEDQIPGMRQHS